MVAPVANEYERSVLRGALNKYKKHLVNRVAANVRKGWKPDPGRADSNVVRLATVELLLARWQLNEGES